MIELARALSDDDCAAFKEAVAVGLADAGEGRTIPYEDVRRWLLSWGSEHELPPPSCP
ncbi:MAG: CopG family transcriptional regulator [Alphaproteobacteria bacterium]